MFCDLLQDAGEYGHGLAAGQWEELQIGQTKAGRRGGTQLLKQVLSANKVLSSSVKVTIK